MNVLSVIQVGRKGMRDCFYELQALMQGCNGLRERVACRDELGYRLLSESTPHHCAKKVSDLARVVTEAIGKLKSNGINVVFEPGKSFSVVQYLAFLYKSSDIETIHF